MRHIALEGRCFVLSAVQYSRRADYPAGYPAVQGEDPATVMIRGGSVIVNPLGCVLAGPIIPARTSSPPISTPAKWPKASTIWTSSGTTRVRTYSAWKSTKREDSDDHKTLRHDGGSDRDSGTHGASGEGMAPATGCARTVHRSECGVRAPGRLQQHGSLGHAEDHAGRRRRKRRTRRKGEDDGPDGRHQGVGPAGL